MVRYGLKHDDVLGLNMMQLPMPVSGADTLSEKRAQKIKSENARGRQSEV
jgi:hypothetical protein